MDKMKRVFLVFFLIFVLSTNVEAHPGRQNPDGGHVCRTNCDDWGLEYGEYHYHNYINRPSTTPDSPIGQPEESFRVPQSLIWGIILISIFVTLIIKSSRKNKTYLSSSKTVIDVTPTPLPTVLYPPDEEVSLVGTIVRTIYRKRPFFVASFIDETGNQHTIVGFYNDKLFTNKKYSIYGTLTHDRKYGKQIKIKMIDRI